MAHFDLGELKGAIGKPKGKKVTGSTTKHIDKKEKPRDEMRGPRGPPAMGGAPPPFVDMKELKTKMGKREKKHHHKEKEHVVKAK